jgi:hypothetical protein
MVLQPWAPSKRASILLLPQPIFSILVFLWLVMYPSGHTPIFFLVLSRQFAHPIQCPVPTNWVSSVINVTRLWGTTKSWLDACEGLSTLLLLQRICISNEAQPVFNSLGTRHTFHRCKVSMAWHWTLTYSYTVMLHLTLLVHLTCLAASTHCKF